MKKLYIAFMSVFMLILSFGSISTLAAGIDGVYVNGSKMIFNDAQPIIVNNRVMVPARAAAEYLGMTVDWNKETETMTFTKSGRTIIHKMRSNVITVNGTALTFDVPSINSMNRTLMPIRMLGESIGADVKWENDLRRVIISTGSSSVMRAEANVAAASSGDSVIVTVVASSDTEKVKLQDTDSGNMVNESFVYNENADGSRVFTLNWIPTASTSGYKSVRAYAGNSSGYSSDTSGTQVVTISIAAGTKPEIKNYYISDYSVDRNDYVTVTVYTNNLATRVKIENDFNTGSKELTSYNTSGENRVFETKIKMSKSGDRELNIYVGNSKGYESNCTNVVIDVDTSTGSSKDDDDDDDKDMIQKIELSDDEVGVGGEITVDIRTHYDIDEIRILDGDDERLGKSIYPKTSSRTDKEKTWSLTIPIKEEGNNTYFVYAYENDDEYYRSFKVKGIKYDDDDLRIISIVQKTNSVSSGDSVDFTVTTTSECRYVEIMDNDEKLIDKVTDYDKKGDSRAWDFTITKATTKSYYVYIYDKDDDSEYKKFTIDFDGSDEAEINSYDLEDTKVDRYDDIEVTVWTNKAVTSIWIEDNDGDRVCKKKTKYTRKDVDEYIWELSFEADEEGRIKYTIYAEDDDGNTDKQSFTVTVRD